MSLEAQQQADLEALKYAYEEAVAERDGVNATRILEELRSNGFKREADTLLGNTRVMDLVTPACKSTWETDDPTQESIN